MGSRRCPHASACSSGRSTSHPASRSPHRTPRAACLLQTPHALSRWFGGRWLRGATVCVCVAYTCCSATWTPGPSPAAWATSQYPTSRHLPASAPLFFTRVDGLVKRVYHGAACHVSPTLTTAEDGNILRLATGHGGGAAQALPPTACLPDQPAHHHVSTERDGRGGSLAG